jgi:transposase
MIGVGSPSRVFLYQGAIDMRKGYDGLSGIIRGELGDDPMNGTLFVFLNRPRNMVKALYWDRDGFALWSKRLERGRFAPPQGDGGVIGRVELSLLLEGVSVRVIRRSPRWIKAEEKH